MVRSRPAITRFLIERGCKTDILMAAALGDAGLVHQHLDADPEAIRMLVSDEYFPMVAGRLAAPPTNGSWDGTSQHVKSRNRLVIRSYSNG